MIEDLNIGNNSANEESSGSNACSTLPSSYTLETLLHIDCLDDESLVGRELEKCYDYCRSKEAQHMFCTQLPFVDGTNKFACYGYRYQVYQFLFGFVYECQTELYNYIAETMLSQCTACMMGYHIARKQLLQTMAVVYDTSSLSTLDLEYLKWEMSRVIASVKRCYLCVEYFVVSKRGEQTVLIDNKKEKFSLQNNSFLTEKEATDSIPVICNALLEVISQEDRFFTKKEMLLTESNQLYDFLDHSHKWKHLLSLMIPFLLKAPSSMLAALVTGLLSSSPNVSNICSLFLDHLCQHFVHDITHTPTTTYRKDMFNSFYKGFRLWKKCISKKTVQLVSDSLDSNFLADYLISTESLIKIAKKMLRFLKTFHPSYKEALCILIPLRSSVIEILQKCHIDSALLVSKVPSDILLNFMSFLIPFPVCTHDSSTLRYCILFLKEFLPFHSLRLTSVYILEDIFFSLIKFKDTFLNDAMNKEEFHSWRLCFCSILHSLPPLTSFSKTFFVQYDFTLMSLEFRLIVRILTLDSHFFIPCHLPIESKIEKSDDSLQVKNPFIIDYENYVDSFLTHLCQCKSILINTNQEDSLNHFCQITPLTFKTIFSSFLESIFKWGVTDFVYEITFLSAATQASENVFEGFLHFPRSKQYFTTLMQWIRQQLLLPSGNFAFLIDIFLRYIPYIYILKTFCPHLQHKEKTLYLSQWETSSAFVTTFIQITHEIFNKLQSRVSTCVNNTALSHCSSVQLKLSHTKKDVTSESTKATNPFDLSVKTCLWVEEFVGSLASFLCGKLTPICVIHLQKFLSILFPTNSLVLDSSKILIYFSKKKYLLFTQFAQALMEEVSPYPLLASIIRAATTLFRTIQIYHVALHAFSSHTKVQLKHLSLSKHSQWMHWCVFLCFSLPALESRYQQVIKEKTLPIKLFEQVETIVHFGWKTVEFIAQSLPVAPIDYLMRKKEKESSPTNETSSDSDAFYISDIIFFFFNMWMSSSLRIMESLVLYRQNLANIIDIENLSHIENFRQHSQWTTVLLPWCVALQEFHIPLLAKKLMEPTSNQSIDTMRLWNQWRLTRTSISIESLCLSIAKGMTLVHRHFRTKAVEKGSFLIRLLGRGDQPANITQLLTDLCDQITQSQKAKMIISLEDSHVKSVTTTPWDLFRFMPSKAPLSEEKNTCTSNAFLKNMLNPMSSVTLKNFSFKPYPFKPKKTGRIAESLLRKLGEEKTCPSRKKGDFVVPTVGTKLKQLNKFSKKWNAPSSLETFLPPSRTSSTLGCTMLVTSPSVALIKKNNLKLQSPSFEPLQASLNSRQRLLPSEKAQAVEKASFYVQKVLNTILEWDVFSLASVQIIQSTHKTERLPISFDNVEDFQRIFEPLVLEECRCSLLQESIERRLEGFPLIVTRSTRLGNTAIIATAEGDCQLKNEACQPTLDSNKETKTLPENKNVHLPFQPWNLVLLIPNVGVVETTSLEGQTLDEVRIPPQQGYALCIVEKDDDSENRYGEASLHAIRLRLLSRLREATTTHIRRIPSTKLTINSKWIGYTLGSLTTSIREVQSLFMSHLSPLFPFILHPQSYLTKSASALPVEREQTLESESNHVCRRFWDKGPTLETVKTICKLNDSQASALHHAFTIDHGVALLQGPPGTGKTHTIWALLALLHFYQTNEGGHLKKKILVCAPSNAAIDEVASRVLAQGLPSFDGTNQVIHPLCLRVGHPQRITRPEVLCISLTENVKADGIKAEQNKKQDYSNHREIISNELTSISTTLQNLPSVHEAKSFQNAFCETTSTQVDSNDLKQAKHQLFTKKKMLHTQMNRLKETFREDMKSTKKKCQETCLRETDILFCTLSGSANECLSGLPIDCIIIDEAAQAVELSTLIPLRLEPLRIVLIGDPQQLPATVLSRAAKKLAYERSLFQRLQECGVQSKMLSIQYRMHPSIARFPSSYFYDNALINAPVVQNRSSLPMHRWKGVFEPFLFFHIQSQENRNSFSQSLSNYDEAFFIVSLLSLLNKHFHLSDVSQEAHLKDFQPTSPKAHQLSWNDISIVTPYKQQVTQIRQLLSTHSQNRPTNIPDVCTIDAFQGREKSIIIFSCVRALNCDFEISTQIPSQDEKKNSVKQNKSDSSIPANLGFVADIRRMNVAITRARDCLWVVGNADTLQRHHAWKAFIDYAKNERNGTCAFINVRDYCEKNNLISHNPKRGYLSRTRPITSIVSNFFAHVEKCYLQEEKKSVTPHKKAFALTTPQKKRNSPVKIKETCSLLEDLSSVSSSDNSDTVSQAADKFKKKSEAQHKKSSICVLPFNKMNCHPSLTPVSSFPITLSQEIPFRTSPSLLKPLQKTTIPNDPFQKEPLHVSLPENRLYRSQQSLPKTVLVAKKTLAYQPNVALHKVSPVSPPHVAKKGSTVKKRKKSISDIPFVFHSKTNSLCNMSQKALQAQQQMTWKNKPRLICPTLGPSQNFDPPTLSDPLVYAQMKHHKNIQGSHLEFF
ncbi:uncharacterized protein LOC128883443 [Hylaeus volcanicus]|uniref:uncharacterized protein LOC128883443 n=1 Tax=Hylaeus volcanicus TaxID=313075 RepID=UPI0023B7D4F4|nr:uncharacterized protein LOC128883443 [Hylaeus volcanicus]